MPDPASPRPHTLGARPTAAAVTHDVPLDTPGTGPVHVEYTDRGTGRPVLLLHGGAGPASISGYAERLATTRPARVVVPTHPGFAGTVRPEQLSDVRSLAAVYAALLDELDLHDVTVIGSSIGGWTAAELGLLRSPRVGRLVLVDAVGIEVAGHPVADFFALSFPQIAQLSYADPDAFRIDPTTMSPEAQAALAGNRAALAAYAGQPPMVDRTLARRLADLTTSTLVVWGDSDGIVDPAYGRAYAAAIPGAQFCLLPKTGHLPPLESPELLTEQLWPFVSAASRPAR